MFLRHFFFLPPIKSAGLVKIWSPIFTKLKSGANLVSLRTVRGGFVRVYMGLDCCGIRRDFKGDTLRVDLSATTAYCSWHGWDTAPLHRPPPRGR